MKIKYILTTLAALIISAPAFSYYNVCFKNESHLQANFIFTKVDGTQHKEVVKSKNGSTYNPYSTIPDFKSMYVTFTVKGKDVPTSFKMTEAQIAAANAAKVSKVNEMHHFIVTSLGQIKYEKGWCN